MSLEYRVISRINPLKPSEPKRFYPSPVYKDHMDLKKLSTRVAAETSLSPTDTLAVLDALTRVMTFFLMEGYILNLGDFGTFRINLNSNGSTTAEEVTLTNIKKFKINFRPGKDLTETVARTESFKAA
jgi:predicted histone-like DNA-binding protein